MPHILRRATEQEQAKWLNPPEALWRWRIGTPEVAMNERYGKYQVKFPLLLTLNEQTRLLTEYGEPEEGWQQSFRASHRVGLSLGFIKDGQYQSTNLIDFLAACFGAANVRAFREWVSKGGGPARPADKDDAAAEMDLIEHWLGWWEDLEILGSIRHEQDREDKTKMWARFGGPMPVGSLPGQKEEDYQALGKGKLRAMILEQDTINAQQFGLREGNQGKLRAMILEQDTINAQQFGARSTLTQADLMTAAVDAGKKTYQEVFGDDDKQPAADDDIPF